jgi:hypothetical protein
MSDDTKFFRVLYTQDGETWRQYHSRNAGYTGLYPDVLSAERAIKQLKGGWRTLKGTRIERLAAFVFANGAELEWVPVG